MSEHVENCMCDICIQIRTKEKIQQRQIEEQSKAYIQRRGEELPRAPRSREVIGK